jgi:hypothetical protein
MNATPMVRVRASLRPLEAPTAIVLTRPSFS